MLTLVAGRVVTAGSVKWRGTAPFDRGDALNLAGAAGRIPGAGPGTILVGVSRSGVATDGLDVRLGPEEVVAAWGPRPTPAPRAS